MSGQPQFTAQEVERWVAQTVAFAEAWGMDERLFDALLAARLARPAEHEQGHR